MFYPTRWDWATYLGTIGLFFTLFYLFIRFLPMISMVEMRHLVHETNEEDAHAHALREEGALERIDATGLPSQRKLPVSRASIYGAAILIGVLGYSLYAIALSPWYTDQNVTREQPVPFSHRHHAGELGIDCRYCHTSVEKSSFAGVPPTQTCMTCHSQIWTNSSMLEPVRASYRTNQSIAWTRVNALPDFVYFDHSIHVSKGVGCGPPATAPWPTCSLTYRAENALYMSWCLDCHRAAGEVYPAEIAGI